MVVNAKEAYEAYSKCKNCTNYNTVKCLSCVNFNKLNFVTETIMNMWYDKYRQDNDITVSQIEDNYEFDSVFERKQDDTKDEGVIDAEVTAVE